MTSKNLLIVIENTLNDISLSNNLGIMFKGYNDFVDVEWRRKMFGVNYTPFSLVANSFQELQAGTIIDFRYSLYIMPFEDDREKLEFIMEEFSKIIQTPFESNDWNVVVKPINLTYGNSFSEGSGRGILRFESLFVFNGLATSNYNMLKDLKLELDNETIPILSYKWEHGKVGYVNKGENISSENSQNLNTNTFVIECPLSKQNDIVKNYLMNNKEVNVNKHLKLTVANLVLIDEEYNYDGFSFSGGQNNQSMNVYLYFTPKRVTNTITINGDSIPILDYALSTKLESLSFDNINSNIYKNIYLGKATSYAFSISEDVDYPVLDTLYEDLIAGEEKLPVYEVTVSIRNNTYEKTLMLSDITSDSDGGAKSVIKVVFIESGEFDG